jgi:putative pyrroloquinoline-quinone binding quinoprotein
MTRTARRRWTRELENEVDGIALGASGPVLLHVYDPPAGDRWIDAAIPGKLGAFDRGSGEPLWISPCEVGYGRGFGAGFGRERDAVVLGPSSNGHRIVRMSLENGELIDAAGVPAFDEAWVFEDLCILSSARRVMAVDSSTLRELWSYAREGERYHHIAREGGRIFVVVSHESTKKQGVLCLDAASGEYAGVLLANHQPVIHDISVDAGSVVLLCSDLAAALPRESLVEYLLSRGDDANLDTSLALLSLSTSASEGEAPLWYESLDQPDSEEIPEVSVSADSGKLYLVRGALLEVRDALTGRKLDEWAVPGLDERVAWRVSQGAGLLAEETRASIFELPA